MKVKDTRITKPSGLSRHVARIQYVFATKEPFYSSNIKRSQHAVLLYLAEQWGMETRLWKAKPVSV